MLSRTFCRPRQSQTKISNRCNSRPTSSRSSAQFCSPRSTCARKFSSFDNQINRKLRNHLEHSSSLFLKQSSISRTYFCQPNAAAISRFMSSKIRVGVIGAGGNTVTKHIPGLLAQTGVEIVKICNRSPQSSQKVIDDLKLQNATPAKDWKEVVESKDIDAVMIGTWPYTHKIMTCAALKNGKHVLCEARAAMNVDEAREMLQVSRENPSLIAQIVPSPLTFTYDNTIQHYVKSGKLGRVLHVDLVGGSGTWLNETEPLTWRQDIDKSGENIMMMGIFYEAMMRWVGPAQDVFALGQTFTKIRKDEEGTLRAVQIPDHLDLLMNLRIGAPARMQFSSVLGHSEKNFGVTIFGSQGTLRLDLDSNQLFFGTKESKMEKVESLIEPQKWRVEEEFINAIRGKERIKLTDLTTALHYMEFTSAVNKSLQTRQLVPVAPYSN